MHAVKKHTQACGRTGASSSSSLECVAAAAAAARAAATRCFLLTPAGGAVGTGAAGGARKAAERENKSAPPLSAVLSNAPPKRAIPAARRVLSLVRGQSETARVTSGKGFTRNARRGTLPATLFAATMLAQGLVLPAQLRGLSLGAAPRVRAQRSGAPCGAARAAAAAAEATEPQRMPPATVRRVTFAGEPAGEATLALKTASEATAKGVVHRYLVLVRQNARRVRAPWPRTAAVRSRPLTGPPWLSGDGEHADARGGVRRRQEAVRAEGHRQRAPGLFPHSAAARRRRRVRPEGAPALPAAPPRPGPPTAPTVSRLALRGGPPARGAVCGHRRR